MLNDSRRPGSFFYPRFLLFYIGQDSSFSFWRSIAARVLT
jgi:hypothetical protein